MVAADRPELTVGETTDLAGRLIAAACAVANVAIAEFGARRLATDLATATRLVVVTIRDHLDATDLITGDPI